MRDALTAAADMREEENLITGLTLTSETLWPQLTLSFLLALNFLRHSTVSCLCIQDATVERCWEEDYYHVIIIMTNIANNVFTDIQVYVTESHRDPGVFERLSCCDPFGWIDGQHLINEIFGFRSHCVPLRRGKLRGGGEEVNCTYAHKITTSINLM